MIPEKKFDCVLCGSCVVDMLVHPVPLESPIGSGRLFQADPIQITTGGIVSNAGIALRRLGMRVAAFSLVGDDPWAAVIRSRYETEGIETRWLESLSGASTSTTAVLIDPTGERSFAHCVGAPKQMNKQFFLQNLELFAESHFALLGYYSLMPSFEADLLDVLQAIRQTGCRTALDAAGDGGTMSPLKDLLPHLDVYVPSLAEAMHQTGEHQPEAIIDAFRACGAPGLLGVKLGSQGAMLSRHSGEYLRIAPIQPPGMVVDTTGAGDCFLAGLLTGLLRGLSDGDAGRLGAATGACCVTGLGASAGLRDYDQTAQLAGFPERPKSLGQKTRG